jgi:hypothetical protein
VTAFADAVSGAQQEHDWPGAGEGDQRPRQRGNRITADHPWLGAAPEVREDARQQLQQAAGGFRNAFDDAQRAWPRHEHRSEEQRH